jgi:hypothetical protein
MLRNKILVIQQSNTVLGVDDLHAENIFLTKRAVSLLQGLVHIGGVPSTISFTFFSPKDYLLSKGKIRADSDPTLMPVAEIMELITEAKFGLIPPFMVPALRLLIDREQIESVIQKSSILTSRLLIVATVPLANGDGEQFLFACGNSYNFRSIIDVAGDPKTTYYSNKIFIVTANQG